MTTPTGVHYMVGTPSVAVAKGLISAGVERIVLAAHEPGADWAEAERLLRAAKVQIEPKWGY